MFRYKFKNLLALFFNIAIAFIIIVTVASFFKKINYFSELDFCAKIGYNKLKVRGTNVLHYFTIDSNLFAAIACIFMIPENIKVITGKQKVISTPTLGLKYMATVALTVTMITVTAYLVPTQGFAKAFAKRNLILHLVTPIMMLVSFMLLENGFIKFYHMLLSLIPISLYGVMYYYKVVYTGNWDDIYGFNKDGRWLLSVIVMSTGSILIALLLLSIQKSLNLKFKLKKRNAFTSINEEIKHDHLV